MSSSKKPNRPAAISSRAPSGRDRPTDREDHTLATAMPVPRKRSLESSWLEAPSNAGHVEWNTFRQDCFQLAPRSMTLAETGARLLEACSRIPGVLADKDESLPFSSFAGVGGGPGLRPTSCHSRSRLSLRPAQRS